MGLISGVMTKVATSNIGQRFYKVVVNPKHESFFNNTLPTIESIMCGGIYVWSTHKQKNIPPDQKRILQWTNVLNTVAGVTIGTIANRAVSKFGNAVIPYIDEKNIPKAHKVITGLKIALPLAATCIIMRYALSTITPLIGSVIEDKRKKKLDVKA